MDARVIDDKVYDDIFTQASVVRARGLSEPLQFARCLPVLPMPAGENVVIISGAGGCGCSCPMPVTARDSRCWTCRLTSTASSEVHSAVRCG